MVTLGVRLRTVSTRSAWRTPSGENMTPQEGWKRPRGLGTPHAVDQVHFVAAPLLAGAAVATTGVLGSDGAQFRWPGPAMLCFTVAAISLIASIQLAFHGRRYLYTPAELFDWWSEEPRPGLGQLQREQREDFERWAWWMTRSTAAYNLGVIILGLGAFAMLAPPEAASFAHTWVRWISAGAAAAAAAWEAALTLRQLIDHLRS